MAWKTMKGVNWATVLPFHAAQWPFNAFTRGEVSMFCTNEYFCAAVHWFRHQVKLSVPTFLSWRCLPSTWAPSPAAASEFLSERFPVGTTPSYLPL